MTILGYGEDALTLHAVVNGLPDIFARLGDDTDAARALVFYRPSFGRRGAPPDRPPGSQFGEFDAIIGTARAVYLVEAKRSASGEVTGSDLQLRPEQIRRHLAFRAYFEEWRQERPSDWTSFATRMRAVFHSRGLRLDAPAAGTTLAKNIAYVLGRLDVCGSRLVDVLLFCRLSDAAPVPETCGTFCIVSHLCVPEDGSEFIRVLA